MTLAKRCTNISVHLFTKVRQNTPDIRGSIRLTLTSVIHGSLNVSLTVQTHCVVFLLAILQCDTTTSAQMGQLVKARRGCV